MVVRVIPRRVKAQVRPPLAAGPPSEMSLQRIYGYSVKKRKAIYNQSVRNVKDVHLRLFQNLHTETCAEFVRIRRGRFSSNCLRALFLR